ncbi:MAG: bifunctional 4-hydroxy-2-oxoglutarate aldolase/2-dehydro-3-deoxy-phosphogluconate aldolase [Rectinemataceae bacterium]|nr:bifunctional 4-hydroxy-2-oxoglutarate aldolase/2-dehydro-3-deoxy-phosphogluconate aldolase [Rectinemataceae bacterium]
MNDILKTIGEIGLVPVVKLESASKAVGLGKALVAGGIPVAEVTFRTAAARDAIAAMSAEVPGLLVGAGTVTTVEQAQAALRAGAQFAVTPGFNAAVVDYCIEHDLPVLPGISGTEGIEKGIEKGLSVLKFFPAEPSGGVAMLDALAGPYANLRFVPTGGIDTANLASYARRPQVLAVGGSWMVRPDMIEAEDWISIERLCREAVMALHSFAFAHVGINSVDESAARKAVALFSGLFGFAAKEGASSIFPGDGIEVIKGSFLGAMGHLAIRCNDVERAVARFAGMGIAAKPETAKMEKGRIKAVYLDLEIGGFAVHLVRA